MMEGEGRRPDLVGFSRVFERFAGFDVLFDPAMLTDRPTHLTLLAKSVCEVTLPCFGKFGFGTGWCRLNIPMCDTICQLSPGCFEKFLEGWGEEAEPEILSLVKKYDRGPGHPPDCRLKGIDEEFNKIGFETNPIWKAIGDNMEKGHESMKELSELIRLN